jgi:uroporphyrinogen decarboxylase
MKPKERILAILNRQPVDRIPVDIWHTPQVGQKLQAHFGLSDDLDLYMAMGLDKIVWVFMDYQSESGQAEGAQAGAGAQGNRTMWGVPLKTVKAGQEYYHEFVEPPMASYHHPNEIDRYPFWPDPDRFDYGGAVTRAERASRDFAVIGPWVSLFEIYCQLRGLEQAMIDLILQSDLVETILDSIEDIQTRMMHRFLGQAGRHLDLVFISDDVAGQNGLLFSPELWRRHLKPRLTRWCNLIHSYGLKVFYHTDGAAERLIGPLIDCGIDVLNPIQHTCPGMELAGLKRRYGDRIIFHGGVDNQNVLPFGSADDVRWEVRQLIQTLGSDGGGYICSSCHNIQANTSIQNVFAMVEAVKRYGRTTPIAVRELPPMGHAARDIPMRDSREDGSP